MSDLMINLDMSDGHPQTKASHGHTNQKHKRFLKRRRYLESKGFLKQKQLPHPAHQQQTARLHNPQFIQEHFIGFQGHGKNSRNFESSTHRLAERNLDRNANSFSSDGFSYLLPQQKSLPKTNHSLYLEHHGHQSGDLTVTVDSNSHNSRSAYFASVGTKAVGHGSAKASVSHANTQAHKNQSWSHLGAHKINPLNEYESGLPPVTGTELPYRFVAIDCEMVGTGPGGRRSDLARCTVVSYQGDVVYDKYIQPPNPITDFRTRWSGIKKQHMKNATPFKAAQKEILKILSGKIVIGHAIHNDFKALNYFHPNSLTRDTSRIPLLNKMAGFNEKESVSLKRLTKQLLNRDIQVGRNGHSSVEDAIATMDLYRIIEDEWERELACNPVQD